MAAWQEAPFFARREQVARAWKEAVAYIGYTRVPDDVFQKARKHFSEKELGDLTIALVTIDGWNRLAVCLRKKAGTYQPTTCKKANGRDETSTMK